MADLYDERRPYWRLTSLGRKIVAAKAARLRTLVGIAESSKLLEPLPGRSRHQRVQIIRAD